MSESEQIGCMESECIFDHAGMPPAQAREKLEFIFIQQR